MIKKVLKIALPLLLGVALLYYFYSEMPENQKSGAWEGIKQANYFWVFISIISALLSHLSRAIRWNYLLNPMGYFPKISSSFYSVMIGYLVNYTIPRAGEASRAYYMQRAERVPFDKGFGTIVTERIVDVVMFLLFLGITMVLLGGEYEKFAQITAKEDGSSFPFLRILFVGAVLGAIALVFFFVSAKFKAFVMIAIEKATTFLKGLLEGLMSILKLEKKLAFIGHTIFIWINYVLMFWLCLLAFPDIQLGFSGIMAAFLAGSLGMMASQGGVGFYILFIVNVLVNIYEIPQELAVAFAAVMWVCHTIAVIIIGLLSFIFIKKAKDIGEA